MGAGNAVRSLLSTLLNLRSCSESLAGMVPPWPPGGSAKRADWRWNAAYMTVLLPPEWTRPRSDGDALQKVPNRGELHYEAIVRTPFADRVSDPGRLPDVNPSPVAPNASAGRCPARGPARLLALYDSGTNVYVRVSCAADGCVERLADHSGEDAFRRRSHDEPPQPDRSPHDQRTFSHRDRCRNGAVRGNRSQQTAKARGSNPTSGPRRGVRDLAGRRIRERHRKRKDMDRHRRRLDLRG